MRELAEETGIREIEFVPGFEPKPNIVSKYKGKEPGNKYSWYLATTEEITVKLSIEHRDYMWLDWSLALDLATHPETKSVISEAKSICRRLQTTLNYQNLVHLNGTF